MVTAKGTSTRLRDYAKHEPPKTKCSFCKLPPEAQTDLRQLLENNQTLQDEDGEPWEPWTLERTVAYFREKYHYPRSLGALRNHIVNCLKTRWAGGF